MLETSPSSDMLMFILESVCPLNNLNLFICFVNWQFRTVDRNINWRQIHGIKYAFIILLAVLF